MTLENLKNIHLIHGSKYGLAGLCSDNGNHLPIMPHPERTFSLSQCQYTSKPLKTRPFIIVHGSKFL